MAANHSKEMQTLAVDDTNPMVGDSNRDGSGDGATGSLAAAHDSAHVDGANTPVSSPQRQQGDRRSPMRTPPSQRRQKKSQRLASSHDENNGVIIPAINANIIQGNTTLAESSDVGGDGSINGLEISGAIPAINVDINNVDAVATADNVAVNTAGESNTNDTLVDPNPYSYTDEELAVINQILEIMNELFPAGNRSNTWPSAVALKDDINERVGNRFGFVVSLHGSSVACTCRAVSKGYINTKEKRRAALQEHQHRSNRKTIKLGCLFVAKFGKVLGKKEKDSPVYITSGSYTHTHGCRPCAQQLLRQNIVGGKYTAAETMREGLQTLMDMMKFEENLTSKTIRKVLKECVPPSVPIDTAFIANVRVRLKKMLLSQEKEEDGKQSKLNTNLLKMTTEDSSKLIEAAKADAAKGALCSDELDNPEYANITTGRLKTMLREALSKDGNDLKKIVTLLQNTRDEDPAFDFRIGRDTLGNVTAIVWQDGTMRGHCSRLLDVVMLDMMKRRQNSIDWPYCGPVLITGEKSITTACEAILVTESIDAYVFVMNATYEMSGVDRRVTKCIFADGIMSASLLRKLGIEDSCNLILDRYHILEVDWPKAFGWHYLQIKTLLKSMVESNTEDEFNARFDEVRKRCPQQAHQDYLTKEVYPNRKHFVSFWTRSYPGHLDRLGNQGSESNHSSYCQRISFGAVTEPALQLVQCLERSKERAAELNLARWKYYSDCLTKRAELLLKGKDLDDRDRQNANALIELAPEGLTEWQECNEELPHYSMRDMTDSNCKEVFRHVDQLQPPRVVGPEMPCTLCKRSKKTMSLCVHDLMYDGGKFNIDRFRPRYHMLSKIEVINRVSASNDASGGDRNDGGGDGNDDPFPMALPVAEGGEDLNMQSLMPTAEDSKTTGNVGAAALTESGNGFGSIELTESDNVEDPVEAIALNELGKSVSRKTYLDILRYLEPFAKIIANHPRQDECIGAMEGMKMIMSGDNIDKSMTLEELYMNHIHQFNASQNGNVFGGNSSSISTSFDVASLEGAKFSSVHNNSKHSFTVTKKRFKPAVEVRQKKTLGNSTAKAKKCSFCQDIQHSSRTSCPKYGHLKPNLVVHNSKEMSILRQDLGDPALHKLLHCPPAIAANVSVREKSEAPVQPWPMEAAHMILKSVYFNFDAVATKTRFAPPPVNDTSKNIIAVQFLSAIGADPIANSSTKDVIFYYRAHEVRELIHNKMSQKKLLFDCMERCSKLS